MAELKIEDEDLYELLEIEFTSSTSEIKKAYRKKALQCHPDKNPDNPNAAKLFHRLTQILEILLDEPARKAYDRVLKGKKEAALRHQQLDSKRRKLKEDLEARERQAASKSESDTLKQEIDRLRKEGSKLVEEEMEYLRQKLANRIAEMSSSGKETDKDRRVKIKWKAEKHDKTNGGYNEELLTKFLSKYGQITALVISKKGGSALIEYTTSRAAQMAVDIETGLTSNPLILEMMNPQRKTNSAGVQSATIKPSDYESVVFTKLRQAEERKRLIEQMIAEESEEKT